MIWITTCHCHCDLLPSPHETARSYSPRSAEREACQTLFTLTSILTRTIRYKLTWTAVFSCELSLSLWRKHFHCRKPLASRLSLPFTSRASLAEIMKHLSTTTQSTALHASSTHGRTPLRRCPFCFRSNINTQRPKPGKHTLLDRSLHRWAVIEAVAVSCRSSLQADFPDQSTTGAER